MNCISLAERDSLEHAATLLWDATSVDPFIADNAPVISEAMGAIAVAAHAAAPIDRAIAVLALAAGADPQAFTRAPDGRAMVGGRILRLMVSTMLNSEPSALPLHQQIAMVWAPAEKAAPDLICRALVLLADHELNVSTFTVRCAASTGLNLHDATIAGLAALKGPKHGGAGALATQLVRSLVDADLAPVIRERVALGERFPGFGHPVYKLGDPRAHALLTALARAGAAERFTQEIPARILEAAGEFANIDYALAVLTHYVAAAGRQRACAVRHGADGGMDCACQRAVALRPVDPSARALHRSGARTSRRASLIGFRQIASLRLRSAAEPVVTVMKLRTSSRLLVLR